MFEKLQKAPLDKIFKLLAEYRADERTDKIDLGIGVYKDKNGNTPIMSSVRKAEKQIFDEATTKTYIGVSGNRGFCDAIADLVFDNSVDGSRISSVQAPGGTGSIWVLLQVIKRARPNGKIWISDPSWPNHYPMCQLAGLEPNYYPYFDHETGKVKFDEMLACLDGLSEEDTVLLHGCCHNPTGANLTNDQWDKVAQSLKRTGAFPFVDLAYLGFGEGLEQDAYGLRKLASTQPEMMLAFSASKNFGLYRERAGVAFCIGKDQLAADIAFSQMGNVVRASYSQPPDHGAEIVRVILNDKDLRKEWEGEVKEVRERVKYLRKKLANAIRERSNSSDFDFIVEHSGMFSLLGLTLEQVNELKKQSAIYMLDDSRISIAGIPEEKIAQMADALIKITR
ncbi:MAG: aspartate/tyrosine/aromatic aminotransferase [Devosiaceae bacterium]|nr:aspartate/tyrosine/aromatic aminotransferase [Devosiaceae bacterium]